LKPLVLYISLLVACLLLFGLAGCRENPASLVGTYSIEENGKLKETIRITQRGDTYLISEKDGHAWLVPTEVTPAGNQEAEDILGTPVTGISAGLGNPQVAVLQVPKGWKLGAFECRTGFWMASALGPIELHKN
jgi:hypothetical protein